MRTDVPGIGAPLLRLVQFFGADPDLSDIRGLICRSEDEPRVVNALVEHFLSCAGEWHVFRWLACAASPTLIAGAHSAFSRANVSGPTTSLNSRSWETLHRQLSVNMRKNLRKAYQYLERDGLTFALRVTDRREDVAPAIAIFHAARAEAADMIFHANRFVQPNVRAFFVGYLYSIPNVGT